ncbi:MAG: OmpA family protein [Maribacter sp.]
MNLLKLLFFICFGFFVIEDGFSQKSYTISNDSLAKLSTESIIENLNAETESIHFDSGSYDLDNSSKFRLERLAEALNRQPVLEILIVAHTDSKGADSYNVWLSEKRAESIKIFLVNRKVSEVRIYVEAFGEKKPKNKCIDGVICEEILHRENRRVEFVIFRD